MNKAEKEVLSDVLETLEAVVNDESPTYEHTINNGSREWIETLNREQHIAAMMEWAKLQLEEISQK